MNAFERIYQEQQGVLTILVTPDSRIATITALGRDEGQGEDEGTATVTAVPVSAEFVEATLLLLLTEGEGQ